MNTSNSKLYTGYIGWSGNAIHAVNVEECNCEKFDGTHSHRDPYAICRRSLGMHYRIGPVTQIRHQEATSENVSCKDCLKRLEEVA